MNEEKSITRIAISYNPPTFKFEYTKGPGRAKHHKNVCMEKYFNHTMSSVERTDIISIVEALTEKHVEFTQVPEETMERMVGKLFSGCCIPRQAANLDGRADVQTEPPTAKSTPCYVDNRHNMRVNMAIERGTLTLSPLKVSKDPLKVSRGLDLKLYRDSFSSTQAASPQANTTIEKSGMNEMRHRNESGSTCNSIPKQIETNAATLPSMERERLERYGDLNRASDEELSMAKNDMNNIFEQYQVLPGDDDYKYDNRVDFQPDDESSWD